MLPNILTCLPTLVTGVKLLTNLKKVGMRKWIFHVNWVETAEDNVDYIPKLSAYRMCLHKPAVKAVRTKACHKQKKQLLSFLGMCSQSRTFIPNYAIEEIPPSDLAHGKGLQPHDKLAWTQEAEKAFENLKIL